MESIKREMRMGYVLNLLGVLSTSLSEKASCVYVRRKKLTFVE